MGRKKNVSNSFYFPQREQKIMTLKSLFIYLFIYIVSPSPDEPMPRIIIRLEITADRYVHNKPEDMTATSLSVYGSRRKSIGSDREGNLKLLMPRLTMLSGKVVIECERNRRIMRQTYYFYTDTEI